MVRPMRADVVVLDYGSGNVRSAVRALERAGADGDPDGRPRSVRLERRRAGRPRRRRVRRLHGRAARRSRGPRVIGRRLAGGRPVLGICVGMQVLFDARRRARRRAPRGSASGRGRCERLEAPVVPHMGWNTVEAPDGLARCSTASSDERFYFVHSYAVRQWTLDADRRFPGAAGDVGASTAATGSSPRSRTARCSATQFHPEKSGDAGLQLLANWVGGL